MKRFILLLLCLVSFAPFGFAVDKEVIRLEQNVALLHGMVRELQRSFDEKMAVMQSLLGQSTDKLNLSSQSDAQLGSALSEMQRSLQASVANTGQKVDNFNTQIQGLHASLDELRARLDKISEQVSKLTAASQNITSAGGGMGQGGVAPGGFDPGAVAPPPQPSPDVLYNTALRDYTGGNYPLALQGFTEYLRFYPDTTLASNAQFYIGDIYYQQGQFPKAIQEYDKAMEQYPNGNKTAAAQLKKAYALLNMDMRAQGVRELNSLVRRFPSTPEANLAKDRLTTLGPDRPAARPPQRNR